MIILQISAEELNIIVTTAVRQALSEQAKSDATTAVADCWFTIEELSNYLPGKPAITTLRGKAQRREIPFRREGKRLVFLKSEIDSWLKRDTVLTTSQMSLVAEQYLNKAGKRGGAQW